MAERAGGVAGHALLSRNFFDRDFLELLFVTEASRRIGVGASLLAAGERVATGGRFFTSTKESNAPMRALLKAQGYAPSGRIENLDPGDPELVFVKLQ